MKKFSALLLVIVMAFSFTGCNSTNIQSKMGSGDKVIATSGSEKILLRDYLYLLGSYKSQTEYYFSYYYGLGDADINEYWETAGNTGDGTMYDDLKEDIWTSIEEAALMHKLAVANGITYNQDDVDGVKASIESAVLNMALPDKTGERHFYEVYMVTPEEAIEAIKFFAVVEAYQESIRSSAEVSDQEVKDFYDDEANYDAIEDLRNITVAHILIGFPRDENNNIIPVTDEEKLEYEAEAQAILSRIVTGEDFGTLAAEYSTDDGSKDNNGEYVITRNENFMQEFMDWTLSAQIGDYGIVETYYGYHIMNLVNVEGFEEMKESIKASIAEEKYHVLLDELISANKMEWARDEDLFASLVYVPYEAEVVLDPNDYIEVETPETTEDSEATETTTP